jgi:hypothetical protein
MATEHPDAAVFAAASAAYERGRAWWATTSVLPLVVVPLGSFAVGHRLFSSAVLGVMLLVIAGALLWVGRELGRGLTVGLKAGIVPLVMSHGANLYGHLCTGDGCTSLCVPACVLGGLVAGVAVALAASRAREPWRVLLSGGGVAIVVGAFGCACVGFTGIIGMMLGTVASVSVTRLLARSA